jgi:hypothetical protein
VRAPRFTPASGISEVPVGRLRRRSCLVVPLASGSDALFVGPRRGREVSGPDVIESSDERVDLGGE